ncbi:MAG: hypothetical protein ACKVS8_08335 [Phycisphaerales bacterium]
MKTVLCVAALAAVCAAPLAARAQSAAASTRLQVQSPNGNVDRSTPGVGSSTLQFASDNFNNGITSLIASATAGGGSLSTFASAAAGFDTTPFVDGGNARATASLSDTLTVRFDGSVAQAVTFNFAVRASGSVTFDGGINTGRTGRARSEYAMTLASSSGSVSASGAVEAGRQIRVPITVIDNLLATDDYMRVEGLGFDDLQLTLAVLPLTDGTTLDLSMSSASIGSVVATDIRPGAAMSATADFGSTLRWMGVVSATLPDGSPYTGGYSITSLSGFDYGAPVPGPGAAALLATGGLIAARRRRV